MTQHFCFLGHVADWIDARLNQVIALRNNALQWVDPIGLTTGIHPGGVRGPMTRIAALGSGNPIAWAIAGGDMVVERFRGAVDMLRLGDGFRAGGFGYVEDGLRAANLVLGPGGRVVGTVRRVGQVLVTQRIGTTICTFVAAYNAQIRTGYRFFINVRDLIKSSQLGRIPRAISRGLDEFQFETLLDTLAHMGIPIRRFSIPANAIGAGWTELENLVATNRRGVFLVTMEFERNNASMMHTLEAIYHPSHGVRFLDTHGAIYNGVQELLRDFSRGRIARNFSIGFIPDSSLVTSTAQGAAATARSAAASAETTLTGIEEGLAGIVMAVVPVFAPPLGPRGTEAAAASTGQGRAHEW